MLILMSLVFSWYFKCIFSSYENWEICLVNISVSIFELTGPVLKYIFLNLSTVSIIHVGLASSWNELFFATTVNTRLCENM